MNKLESQVPDSVSLRQRLYQIIYESDTPAGKWFDILLIVSILLSVVVVMLDSVNRISVQWRHVLSIAEWGFTVLFSIEYLLRIYSIRRASSYLFSFYGIVDFIAIVPAYLSLFVYDIQFLLIVRVLRILRIFRVLKLGRYISQVNILLRALNAGKIKVIVFLFFISTIVILFGSTMYLIEGPENGFTSIPRSIYWAIITLTTVGYGDITPKTDLGQALASFVMVMGYAIIAVPTGIFTAELSRAIREDASGRICPNCNKLGHDSDAKYCNACGAKI